MPFKPVVRTILFACMAYFLCSPINPTYSAENFSAYEQRLPGTDITIAMVPITGGEFLQGSPESEQGRKPDEGPQFTAMVDDFWMGKYEITWQQYELFMQRAIDEINALDQKGTAVSIAVDGVSAATTPYVDMSFGMGKIDYPAINVTQYAASMFCKWLSAHTGHFYRLPTETEWEYACRANQENNDAAFSFGSDWEKLDDYAWYYENSQDKYHPVGQKKPNKFGLYDMHGNVSEWTLDQYDPEFYKEQKSYNGLIWNQPNKLYPRTTRGGSWYDDPDQLRSAARKPSQPKWKRRDPQIPKSQWWLTNAPFVGFRVIRPRKSPSAEDMELFWGAPIKDL